MITVPVPIGERSYEVRIGVVAPEETAAAIAGALRRPTGVAVLMDSQLGAVSPRAAEVVAALAARLPRVQRFDLAPGEAAKNLSAIERTCQWLAERGYDRGAALVGIGGGAASDHAGFAAAVYLRGIDFAVVSTTLLGMVDASVGGKTGVDLAAGKNLVGAFHQPRAVVADLGFLQTLPAREQAAGMAEVVKAGLIADPELLARIEADVEAGRMYTLEAMAPAIAAAVRMKVGVVSADERESDRRAILNFGHTLGHALEAESAYGLLHGEAVSLGMVAALAFGSARGISDPALRPRAARLLARLGLPVDVERRISPEVLARIEVDKKRRADRVGFVFVPRVGEARVEDIALADLRRELPAALAATGGTP
jgi:3-dehydroquinate synthase